MSLVCNECEMDMGPSESFPGREGVMVHPVLITLAYLPTEKGVSYKAINLESQRNVSLCFKCIEKKLPEERMEALSKVYTAYENETEFEKVKENQLGRWCDSEDAKLWLEVHSRSEKSFKGLEEGCLFCSEDIKAVGTFFRARGINRVYSSKHLSGMPFGGLYPFPNYSWSNLKEGGALINFCFNHFRANFVRCFNGISYSLTGEGKFESGVGKNEMYLSPEFEKAYERESGKNMDEYLKELFKDVPGGLRIIRKEKQ